MSWTMDMLVNFASYRSYEPMSDRRMETVVRFEPLLF